jgi:hypothetical protein
VAIAVGCHDGIVNNKTLKNSAFVTAARLLIIYGVHQNEAALSI